jgi:putative intracellular protease/amidase
MPFRFRFLRAVLLGATLLLAAGTSARAAHEAHAEPKIRVGIVLFDGVEIIDFGAPYEVFGTAGFGVETLSSDGKPVTTAMGLKVTPDRSFAQAPVYDVLLVPGGDVGEASRDARILDFLRARAKDAKAVLSVCTGASILGASGLLDGLKATTFKPRIDQLAKAFPKVQVVRDVRWVDNGVVITSAGLASGIDAALHVVARLRGVEVARSTAVHLEYDWKPEGGFVRTLLADRYLPNIDGVRWPADAKFESRYAYGDRDHWRARYATATRTPPQALLALIAAEMGKAEGWKDAGGGVWRAQREGRSLRLAFAAGERDPAGKGYLLDITLDAQ